MQGYLRCIYQLPPAFKTMNRTLKLLISILAPLVVGAVAGFYTVSETGTWYSYLNKPFFNPPNWLFGPVWTILYILMGISCFLIWSKPSTAQRSRALTIYAIQLFLNFWWSIIFFALHKPAFALIEIAFMWIAIFLTIRAFLPISKVAAWLLIPYLMWVSFASILNAAIVWLN